MPKDKKINPDQENDSSEATAATTPGAAYTPPAEPVGAGLPESSQSVAATAPVGTNGKRRLGTAAIIGISAAGLALLAGVFGGGMALGVSITHHEFGDKRGQVQRAEGPTHNGNGERRPMQGGFGEDR